MRSLMWRTTFRSCEMKTNGDLQPLAQLVEQVDDLRLDRRVERGDRLVGDQHLRADGERPRDADALALAAAQRVRQVVLEARREADRHEQLVDALGALGARRRQRVHLQHLVERLRQAHARIERRIRILEHHLDAPARRSAACCRPPSARPCQRMLPSSGAVEPAQAARPACSCRSPTRRRCRASRPVRARARRRGAPAGSAAAGASAARSRRRRSRSACRGRARSAAAAPRLGLAPSTVGQTGSSDLSARRQALRWPASTSIGGGTTSRQAATANAQRGWKRHPGGGCGEVGRLAVDRPQPLAAARVRRQRREQRPRVRMRRPADDLRGAPDSTILPAYITATRSQVCAMTPMSWVTSSTLMPISVRSFRISSGSGPAP